MQVTNPPGKIESTVFELSARTQYPFADLPAQLNMAITRFWKSEKFFWLRLEDPDSGETFDFRIIKIYRMPEGTHVAVSPAKRWNQKRSLTEVTAMAVVHQTVLRTMTEDEVASLRDSLHLEESFQINGDDPDYEAIFADQVMKTFGPCAKFDPEIDSDSLALTAKLVMAGEIMPVGREIEIDVETTVSDPGFLKLLLDGKDDIFRIVAYFEQSKTSYLAVQRTAEHNEGLLKPDIILLELKSKHFVKILSQNEFGLAAASIMDACEKSGAQRKK